MKVKYKKGDIVNFIEKQYRIRNYKKRNPMYLCPVYDIESVLPNGIGDFLNYKDIPETLLK